MHLELDSGINACNFKKSSLRSSLVFLVALILLIDMMNYVVFISVFSTIPRSRVVDGGKKDLLKKGRKREFIDKLVSESYK